MANSVAIFGLQWGDEGKGKIVDLLTADADCTVRFQGGHNAGHTLVIDEKTIALHLIPSGIMYPDTACVIGNGVVLDCAALLSEIDNLEQQGIEVKSRLFISPSCPLILPTHAAIDKARETGKHAIGTTKRGIGPAYEDKVGRRSLRFGDLVKEDQFTEKLHSLIAYHNFLLAEYHHAPTIDYEDTLKCFLDYKKQLLPMMRDVNDMLFNYQSQNKHILFEGAQGTLLDIDHGTYPYVTSSNTTIGSIATGTGIMPSNLYALGIAKAYATRVGSGPFPTEINNQIGEYLGNKGHEFGVTTGRKRACGWFDAVLVKHAIRLNTIDGICLTKLDVLDELEEIKVCTAYQATQGKVTIPPCSADELSTCQPIYESLPGWQQSTFGITDYQQLPANAQAYIKRLEQLIGVPITIISTSPKRRDTMILQSPFN